MFWRIKEIISNVYWLTRGTAVASHPAAKPLLKVCQKNKSLRTCYTGDALRQSQIRLFIAGPKKTGREVTSARNQKVFEALEGITQCELHHTSCLRFIERSLRRSHFPEVRWHCATEKDRI